MNYYERTITTPEGNLRDIKRAMTVVKGCGTGPEVVEPLIKDVKKDLPLLKYMHPDVSLFDHVYDNIRETVKKVGDRGVVNANLYSPIDCRCDVMRQEDFLMLYHDDKEAFREIVQFGADAMMAETKRALDTGLKVIKTWWFYASPSSGWSPRIYEEMFLPHLIRHVELIHSYPDTIYLYYDDGKMGLFIDFYVEAGVDALMTLTPPPMGDIVPEIVKGKYGRDVALMGGFDFVNELCWGSPGNIRKIVKERLEIFKPGGGYIMDGSNMAPYETPIENLRAFIDTGLEFGGY
jgi:uroporphyrinogen-III decarboxylase